MRLTNVPPPMALHEIILESNPVDVAIAVREEDTKSIWIAVLHHEGCSLYEWPLTSMRHKPPIYKWTAKPKHDRESPRGTYLQAAFSAGSSGRIFLLLLSHDVHTSELWVMNQDGRSIADLSSHGHLIEGIVPDGLRSDSATLILTEENDKLAGEALNKKIADFNEDHDLKLLIPPFAIARKDIARYGHAKATSSNETPDHEDIVFSLADNGSLFANQNRLARNCTSFLVTPAHLIFTTSQHLLKFVHLADPAEGGSPSERGPRCSPSDHVIQSLRCLLTHRRLMNDAVISKEGPSS